MRSAARRRGHREAALESVEDGLDRLRDQLRHANGYAQGTLLGELDALRDRIARAPGSG